MIRATQEGDNVFVAAEPVEQSFVILKADQTITFDEITDKATDDEPFAVVASSSSGLPVVLEVSSGPATLAGDVVTITGAGTVTIVANQEGNELYSPAPQVRRSFEVIQIVGIEERLMKKVQLFPNPAADYVTVEVSGEGEAMFTLIDSGGSPLWSTLTSAGSVNVPVSAYPAGVYVLRVKTREGTMTIKIVRE